MGVSDLVRTATVVAALGTGVVAGVWFAFSAFVMAGLARLPDPAGVAAMQAINRTAVTPPLMVAMFGTGALCLALVVWAGASPTEPGARLVLAGGVLYLAGTIAVTVAANVPRNDRLAALAPDATATAAYWQAYLTSWTAWNHVRCVTTAAATALLLAALSR